MALDLKLLQLKFSQALSGVGFHAFESIDSTSGFLIKRCEIDSLSFCITNEQTAGYGQRGSKWLSNKDSLTFSYLKKLPVRSLQIQGFAQYLGLRLASVLNSVCSESICIKWPNDLYVSDKKVAGLLVEICNQSQESISYVIGLGINFSSIKLNIEQQIQANTGFLTSKISHEDLVVLLTDTIHSSFNNFFSNKTIEWLELYKKLDYFTYDQQVVVYDSGLHFDAVYKGVTPNGELLLEVDGSLVNFRSAQISVRAK